MKWAVMYVILIYITYCADDVPKWDKPHSLKLRIIRAILWPATVTVWFRIQNSRLHRMLLIVWVLVITSWFLTLLEDRIFS